MAKTLPAVLLFLLIVCALPSCKKCYTCVDTCSTCILLDSTHAVADQQKLCSDSTYYMNLKDSLTAKGYTCTNTASSYKDDWCVNDKNAVAQYLPYHEGNGKYTCSPK